MSASEIARVELELQLSDHRTTAIIELPVARRIRALPPLNERSQPTFLLPPYLPFFLLSPLEFSNFLRGLYIQRPCYQLWSSSQL